MSYQVVKVTKQGYSRASLGNIGNELDRAEGVEHRNSEINPAYTYLNKSFKDADKGGWYKTFDRILKETGASFTDKKGAAAFQGIVITSDTAFFENLGWVRGQPAPKAVEDFFEQAYDFAVEHIGYHGTDTNIISAKVHYDETTPHLQLDFIPITDDYKIKVYAKDENGKVLRNEKGSPVQLKDENGKYVFEHGTAPKVAKADFWRERGGQHSFTDLQDDFFEEMGERYGLERGEKGANKKSKTNHQYRQEQFDKEILEYVEALNPTPTKTEKNIFGKEKVVPKTPEEIQRDKDIATAQLILKRSADLDKRESFIEQKQAKLNKLAKQVEHNNSVVTAQKQQLDKDIADFERKKPLIVAAESRRQAQKLLDRNGIKLPDTLLDKPTRAVQQQLQAQQVQKGR